MRTNILTGASAALLLTAGAALADYPDEQIEVIVGYGAGGGTDVMARTVTPFLEKYLGEDASIVVKNMPGASGQIGVTAVAESDPDGYTIGTYNLPGMMARTLDREATYGPDSFAYIANVVNDPNVIVTPGSSEIDTIEEVLEAALAEPGSMTSGISGLGTDDHFFMLLLEQATGAQFNTVAFDGTAAARAALMGGHIGMGIMNLSEAMGFTEELNVIGVAAAERSPMAPDLPTLGELGYEIVNGSLRGFVAPADLPEEVRAELIGAFERMFEDPEFQAAMEAAGNPLDLSAGDDFEALNAAQLELAKQVWGATPWN